MTITTTIKSIQDIMRKDVGVDGDAQRISQIVWMIFLKIFDDQELENELMDDAYRSPIPEHLRWRNWAADPEGITGDELLDFVNNRLFQTLKNLQVPGKADRRALLVRSLFEDAYNYMKSGTLMRQVINKINEIDFNRTEDRHLFNDIYEKILKDLQSAGNAGEYYTPRAVTQFMVDMVAPKLGERILDPACGTGGFLACAIEHIRKQYVKSVDDEAILQKSINGVEKKAAAPSAVRHQHDAARHRSAPSDPARQHPGAPPAHLRPQRPRGRGGDQPALRRHGGRRHRVQFSQSLSHPRNRRSFS